MKNKAKYEVIINLTHHTSTKHPHMSMADRAAQFSPFAALTGYSAAIEETARFVGSKLELDENIRLTIDMKLQKLADRIAEKPFVTLKHFRQDSRKDGGEYVITEGNLKKIDEITKTLHLTDGTVIDIESLLAIGPNNEINELSL